MLLPRLVDDDEDAADVAAAVADSSLFFISEALTHAVQALTNFQRTSPPVLLCSCSIRAMRVDARPAQATTRAEAEVVVDPLHMASSSAAVP